MSFTRPIAILVSCGLHLLFVVSLWTAPASPQARASKPIEVELRQVEARRSNGPERRASSPRRTRAPPVVTPVIEATEPTSHPVPEGGGEPGDDESPGGGGDAGIPVAATPPPPPDTSPQLLALPRIVYPENARSDDVEGVVRLWVQLDEQGRVISVEIREDPGSGLGEAARRALLEATFRPATHLGAGAASAFEYVYRFQLY